MSVSSRDVSLRREGVHMYPRELGAVCVDQQSNLFFMTHEKMRGAGLGTGVLGARAGLEEDWDSSPGPKARTGD